MPSFEENSYDDDDDDGAVDVELVETYGESGTGKSCLLHHFAKDCFKDHSQHTIGVEFSSRLVKVGDRRVKVQLWDTAGQERFRSVTRSYYRGAAGVILVFDITNRTTFASLQKWLDDARALASPQLVTVLVGAKCDREDDRQVTWAEASRWAEEREIHYLEVSALTGFQTHQPFLFITRSVLLLIESGALDPEKTPGSGVSYGSGAGRGGYLRRMRSGSAWSTGGESGRLSVLLGTSSSISRDGRRRWPSLGRRGKCC